MNTELKRLEQALEADSELRSELARQGDDPASRAAWARAHGFDVTAEELAARAADAELSDDDLEKVAGGWDGTGDGSDGGGG